MSRTFTLDHVIDAKRRRVAKLYGRTFTGSSILKHRVYAKAGETKVASVVLDVSEIQALVMLPSRKLTLLTNGGNELQSVTVDPTAASGSFDLTFGFSTASFNWNASTSSVQSGLEGMGTIGVGNVSCSGGPFPTNPITVEFIGALAGLDVTALTVTSNVLLDGLGNPLADPVITTIRNGGGTPGDTINFRGNRPVVWFTPGHWAPCPLTTDTTVFYLTNSTGHDGRLQIFAFMR